MKLRNEIPQAWLRDGTVHHPTMGTNLYLISGVLPSGDPIFLEAEFVDAKGGEERCGAGCPDDCRAICICLLWKDHDGPHMPFSIALAKNKIIKTLRKINVRAGH